MIINITTKASDDYNLRVFDISETNINIKISEDEKRFSFAYVSNIDGIKAITTVDFNKNDPRSYLGRTWNLNE